MQYIIYFSLSLCATEKKLRSLINILNYIFVVLVFLIFVLLHVSSRVILFLSEANSWKFEY